MCRAALEFPGSEVLTCYLESTWRSNRCSVLRNRNRIGALKKTGVQTNPPLRSVRENLRASDLCSEVNLRGVSAVPSRQSDLIHAVFLE